MVARGQPEAVLKYSEAVDFLDSRVVLGVKPSLDRIEAACRLMGDPREACDWIQVTGTNGKTSVSHMAAAMLRKGGYRTGLFTSPHLETVRERVVVDGRLIPAVAFAELMMEIAPAIEEAERQAGEGLTYFEVITALALKYFQLEEVDVAVLEVGMGGRWDSTNVVDSRVAVITNVGLDHVSELGETREQVAGEKVGIINTGAAVVTAESDPDILALIEARCAEVGARMMVFGRDFRLDYHLPYQVPGQAPAQVVSLTGLEGLHLKDVKLPMTGKHQAVNAACAVAACQAYAGTAKIGAEACREALENSRVPGRLEVLSERPLVLADGAHNVMGIEKLAAALTGEFDYEKLVVVVAILADKDARGMLRLLGAVADELVLTENRSARSIKAERLASYCRMERIRHTEAPDFSKAMEHAYNIAGHDGLICVTGSLYTVSEARILFKHQKASREMRQDR